MEKKENKLINETTIGMAQTTLNQIYGEMTSQIIQAYNGMRVDSHGNEIPHHGRNLKDISNYKVNPDYKDTNIKQQSGFVAELLEESRQNKEAIANGDTTRTRTTDGIGRTNDTKYDHVKVDQNGNVVEGSGTQMKFLKVKENPKTGEKSYNVIDKLANDESWDRYDGDVLIPKEDYEGAVKYAKEQYEKNMELAKKAKANGKIEAAKKYEKRAKDYKKASEKIKPSKVTTDEAIEGRVDPKKIVTKEFLKDINDAGLSAAKSSMAIAASVSLAQNIYALVKEDKDIEEVTKDIAKTTVKAGAAAYVVGAGGSAVKAVMHTSKNQILRRAGTTSLPTLIVVGALEIGKSLKKYSNNEIDTLELLQEMGEKGTGMMASGYCAILGTVVAGPLGGFVGSMIGYNISSVLYQNSIKILKDEKIAREQRIVIERICNAAMKQNEEYRKQFIELSKMQLQERERKLVRALNKLDKSIINNNIDDFFDSINDMGRTFGVKLQFETMEEFDDFMSDSSTVLEF